MDYPDINDELLCYTGYLQNLSEQLDGLRGQERVLIESGDDDALAEVHAQIGNVEDLIGRVQHKRWGLLKRLIPIAWSSARNREADSRRETLNLRNRLNSMLRWLNKQEAFDFADRQTTALYLLMDDHMDFQAWMDWEFRD